MNSVKYASSSSKGTFAPYIGWIDFGSTFELIPGENKILVENKIPGGYVVQFCIKATASIHPTTDTKIGRASCRERVSPPV